MLKRKATSMKPLFDRSILLQKTKLLIDEAAFLLDVTPRTVDRYMTQGKISFIRTPGGHRRPLTFSVKRYL
jgi:excisionase family DNA binding protein